MSVSTVGSSSASSVKMSFSSSQSIAQLQKEMATVQKQITAETKSSDDTKTKQQVVQALQAELASIQMMIEQKQAQQAQAPKAPTAAPGADAAASSRQSSSKKITASVDDGVGVNLDSQA